MFKDVLARLIEEKKVSKSKFAQQMGVSRTTLYSWLDGNTHPDAVQIQKISEILDAAPSELLNELPSELTDIDCKLFTLSEIDKEFLVTLVDFLQDRSIANSKPFLGKNSKALDAWVIEYSFYYDAFGVVQLKEYIQKARLNYAKQQIHPYIVLGAFETQDEASKECSKYQQHRNENGLSYESRMKAFQKAVDGLKSMLILENQCAQEP